MFLDATPEVKNCNLASSLPSVVSQVGNALYGLRSLGNSPETIGLLQARVCQDIASNCRKESLSYISHDLTYITCRVCRGRRWLTLSWTIGQCANVFSIYTIHHLQVYTFGGMCLQRRRSSFFKNCSVSVSTWSRSSSETWLSNAIVWGLAVICGNSGNRDEERNRV